MNQRQQRIRAIFARIPFFSPRCRSFRWNWSIHKKSLPNWGGFLFGVDSLAPADSGN